MIDYTHFANICANSASYNKLIYTFDHRNKEDEIVDICKGKQVVIGRYKGNMQDIILQLHKNRIFSAKCGDIIVYNESIENDTSSLAWAYIDLLTLLAQQLGLQNAISA